jgi:hypothetical protein
VCQLSCRWLSWWLYSGRWSLRICAEIMSAAARPLPEASPITNAGRSSVRGTKWQQSPPRARGWRHRPLKSAEPVFYPGPCINRCWTSQASTKSWLTSTTTSSVVISQPPLICRFWLFEIGRPGMICGWKKIVQRDVENAAAAPTTLGRRRQGLASKHFANGGRPWAKPTQFLAAASSHPRSPPRR